MTRTTQEWQQLLDGTTPGPWMVHSDDYLTEILGHDREGRAGFYPVIDTDDFRDAPLIAVAPEAVAEVIRLRTTLEEVRDHARDVSGNPDLADWLTNILDPEEES